MDWRVPLSLAILLFADMLMYSATSTTSAWDEALNPEHRFSLKVLSRLPHGETLQHHPKNPVRSRMILDQLARMGLAEEKEPHAWAVTFLGRRVAKMLDLEGADALPHA